SFPHESIRRREPRCWFRFRRCHHQTGRELLAWFIQLRLSRRVAERSPGVRAVSWSGTAAPLWSFTRWTTLEKSHITLSQRRRFVVLRRPANLCNDAEWNGLRSRLSSFKTIESRRPH